MSADEFRAALEQLGVSQIRWARLVGAEKGTVNRWANGLSQVPGSVHVLLAILLETDLTIEDLEQIMVPA